MLFDHFMQSERIRLYSQNKAKDESVYDFLKMIRFLFFLRNMELFKYENGVLPFMDLKSMDKGSMLEESILESMALSEQEESLMRVGFLLAQVSYAQYDNKLKNSPILEKVNFNGMDIRGVKRLITILEEKMRQYNLFYKNNVLNLQKLNIIIAKASGVWTLNNNENVFYIMAGYSIQRASRYKNDIGEGVTDQEEVQQTEIENEN